MNKDNKAATDYKVVKSKWGKATKTAGPPITYLFKGVPLYERVHLGVYRHHQGDGGEHAVGLEFRNGGPGRQEDASTGVKS